MKYQIIRNDGTYELKLRANEYLHFLQQIQAIGNKYENDFTILIDNNKVSVNEANDHCYKIMDEKLTKKLKTHKQIWVRDGVTNAKNNWHQKWIKQ